MGDGHVKKYNNVPGVSDLTGARFVLIFDRKKNVEDTITFNATFTDQYQKSIFGDKETITFCPEVLIQGTAPVFTPLSSSADKSPGKNGLFAVKTQSKITPASVSSTCKP